MSTLIRYVSLLLLLCWTHTVSSCMPTTSTSNLQLVSTSQESKNIVRRAPQAKIEPGKIRITINNQEQLKAKTFLPTTTAATTTVSQIELNQNINSNASAKPTEPSRKVQKEVPDDNLAEHRAAFQKAKAFRQPSLTTSTLATFKQPQEEKRPQAKAKASKRLTVAENNKLKHSRQNGKFFEIESNVCKSCPELLMPTNGKMKKICDNWNSLEKNFSMVIDPKKPRISNYENITTCSRNITCSAPHAIIKWPNFHLCDILTEVNPDLSFTFTCNGTHWFVNKYPIEAVSCGMKK